MGLASSAAAAQTLSSAADGQRGRQLALSLCASCHLVDANQPTVLLPGPPAPSFEAIANTGGLTPEALRARLRAHQAFAPDKPSMLVSDDQIAPITAYIMSLKRQP